MSSSSSSSPAPVSPPLFPMPDVPIHPLVLPPILSASPSSSSPSALSAHGGGAAVAGASHLIAAAAVGDPEAVEGDEEAEEEEEGEEDEVFYLAFEPIEPIVREIEEKLSTDFFVSIRAGMDLLLIQISRLATDQIFAFEDCPPMWKAPLLRLFRLLVQKARDDNEFFAVSQDYLCHIADSAIGTSLLFNADVISFLVARFRDGSAHRSAAIYFFCCMLHSPRTRNQYVQQVIEQGIAVQVLAHLPATADEVDQDPEQHAWNLALNWIGGSDVGARFLLPHVPRILAVLTKIEDSHSMNVTLTLILANFSAFLDNDPAGRALLLATGLADRLLEKALLGVIRAGSVGALMGLINLRVHVGENPLLEISDRMLTDLLQCLAFSLESKSQENILWSPWHPAQAIANLCLRKDLRQRIVTAGFVPLLIAIVRFKYEGNQAEPEKDEMYACKALAELSDTVDVIEELGDIESDLYEKIVGGAHQNTRYWAQVIIEAHRGRLRKVLTLEQLSRRAFRRVHSDLGFPEFVEFVNTLVIPRQLKHVLCYHLQNAF